MRMALISDIHGNATALEAVLADVQRQAADAVVCLGDMATLGPQPARVLEMLADLRCPCILGNHEAALFQPAKALDYHIGLPLVDTLLWCAQQLTAEHLAFLQACVPAFSLPLGSADALLCFHGSPRSNVDQILAQTPAEELDRVLAGHSATIMAGGHTHIQLLRQHHGRYLVNPGSVGGAFLAPVADAAQPTLLPWAEYAIVSWVGASAGIDFRRVSFDIGRFLQIVDQSDLPMKAWWRQQYMRANAG